MVNSQQQQPERKICIACIGNSIQYFNDCPRFLEELSNGKISHQDSCLRGGASLVSIIQDGNGMKRKFGTPSAAVTIQNGSEVVQSYDIGAPTIQALLCGASSSHGEKDKDNSVITKVSHKWDFIMMNDHTQSPARSSSREKTIQLLQSEYVPLIRQCGGIPILLMTAAYRRRGVMNSDDLGSFHEFTNQTYEGYLALADAMSQVLPSSQQPRIAPVGLAFQKVYLEDRRMWERLYHYDDFHPSPHGTFLQGCVLHFVMFGCLPDINKILLENNETNESVSSKDLGSLWRRARMMQPEGDEPLPMVTYEEALYLLDVAKRVCEEFQKEMKGTEKLSHL